MPGGGMTGTRGLGIGLVPGSVGGGVYLGGGVGGAGSCLEVGGVSAGCLLFGEVGREELEGPLEGPA